MAEEHIVMFPYMAQGHFIPFLALAKLISKSFPTYTVTFINTPLNIQKLQPSLSMYSNIDLLALPFRSSDYGLPPGSESTDSVPTTQWIQLTLTSESLKPHFARAVSDLTRKHGRPPLLIIADAFLGWTVEIAREFDVFHASLPASGAYTTAAFFAGHLNLPHKYTDLPEFPNGFKIHQSLRFPRKKDGADGDNPWSRFLRRQIYHSLKSDAMLCNTMEEIEIEGLRMLRADSKLKVWAIGPLLPPIDPHSSSEGRVGRKSVMEEEIIKWLDSHTPGSVIYVSFGSQNSITSSQMMSLATGLESSGHPFVWVIRPPIGFDLNAEFRDEWLPDGFESRMKEKKHGLVVRGWAPQLEILSHESVGAFLTHCGWNAFLESLSTGVVMLTWPLVAEHFYTSKMVEEELGLGVELARGAVDEVTSDQVEQKVRLVMAQAKEEEMMAKVLKFKETMRNAMIGNGEEKGSSIRAVEEFIGVAISLRSEK